MSEQVKTQHQSSLTLSPGKRACQSLLRIRYLAVPAMLGALGLYILLHSPLFGLPGCIFCGTTLSIQQALIPLSALWLIMAATGAAWVAAKLFNGALFERPIVFGLSAFAFIVIPAAILGGIADRMGESFLQPPLGPLLASLPSDIVIGISLARGWRPQRVRWRLNRSTGLVLFMASLSAVVLFAATAISLMHPATSGDALSYHANLAVYLWKDGNLGAFLDRAPDIWALAHPGMVELWFGLLRILGGESLANLGQLPFTLLGVCAIYAFTRRLGLRQGAGLLAGLTFPLVPIVATQSVMQPNDVAGAALVMSSIALASAPVSSWTRGRVVLLGIGLGLVATAKLSLLPYVIPSGLFCAGALLLPSQKTTATTPSHRRIGRESVLLVVILAVTFLITVEPWWVRNLVRYANPIYPSAIPFIGRGVFLQDMGVIDTAFVPRKLAWPLYPLIEPHDDRSGFGALFLIGAVPGFVFALLQAKKRQPIVLFLLNALFFLPAWWFYSLHEPRFFLAMVGLSFGFIPWALLAVPRQWQRLGGLMLAAGALFSVLVTFDQALLPFARQPSERPAFYDRVWGVDPYVTSLPENEGILLHTGFAPTIFEYTAFYPLLGPQQSRLVIPIDGEKTSAFIAACMREAGLKYAYIAVSPANRIVMEKMYDPTLFELVHQSYIVVGEKSSARRVLYRPADPSEEEQATVRYLFRLK